MSEQAACAAKAEEGRRVFEQARLRRALEEILRLCSDADTSYHEALRLIAHEARKALKETDGRLTPGPQPR